jgi:hypothetical protein
MAPFSNDSTKVKCLILGIFGGSSRIGEYEAGREEAGVAAPAPSAGGNDRVVVDTLKRWLPTVRLRPFPPIPR